MITGKKISDMKNLIKKEREEIFFGVIDDENCEKEIHILVWYLRGASHHTCTHD